MANLSNTNIFGKLRVSGDIIGNSKIIKAGASSLDALMGNGDIHKVGNANGNISLNNGTLNTNLIAEKARYPYFEVTTANAELYLGGVSPTSSGYHTLKATSKASINSSTGTITAPLFSGNLSGATGTLTDKLTVHNIFLDKADDSLGIFPASNNYSIIGKSDTYWYRSYITNMYGSTITFAGDRYYTSGNYAVNLSNSDIIGANGIYFADAMDSSDEGLNFVNGSNYDTLYSSGGRVYLKPNHAKGTDVTGKGLLFQADIDSSSFTISETGRTTKSAVVYKPKENNAKSIVINDTWRGIQVDGTAFDPNTINFKAGSNVSLSASGNDLTINSSYVDRYHSSGSWDDVTYTATNNGTGCPDLAFTIPDVYVRNTGDTMTGDLNVPNIRNLSVGGGIYWNPHVESASDGTDAASITVLKSGSRSNTELRISVANDSDDIINLVAPAYIYFNGKQAFNISDGWLRINEAGSFNSGTYFGSTVVRTDGSIQVGGNGSNVLLNSSGITTSKDLFFSDAGTITWKSGNWYQRIKNIDDETSGTHIFEFQQSSNSGSTYSTNFSIRDDNGVETGKLYLTDSGGIKYKNSHNTYNMIRFIDGDVNGAGIAIGGGGRVVIGSGESSDNFMSGGADESLRIASDGNIDFYTNYQTAANAKHGYLDTDLCFHASSFNMGGDGKSLMLNNGNVKACSDFVEHYHLPKESDLNTIYTNGIHYNSQTNECATMKSVPEEMPHGEMNLSVTWLGADKYVVQDLVATGSSGTRRWYRTGRGENTWSPWKSINKWFESDSYNADGSKESGLYSIYAGTAGSGNPQNHSLFVNVKNVGTPFQLQIPDSDDDYIYKWTSSQGWRRTKSGYSDSSNISNRAIELSSNHSLTDQANYIPNNYSLRYDSRISDGTSWLFNTTNNANSIITINKHEGKYNSQLGFSSDGRLYYRDSQGSDFSSEKSSWEKIAFISDINNGSTYYESNNIGIDGENHIYLKTTILDTVHNPSSGSYFTSDWFGTTTNVHGPYFRVIRNNSSSYTDYYPQHGSGIAWGENDTHGYLYTSYHGEIAYIGGGNANNLTWKKQIEFKEDTNATYVKKAGDTMTGALTFTTTNGILYKGTKNTYNMIRFIDNTGDAYGNGIIIGGGGKTVIGAGESENLFNNSGGSEIMIVSSDGDINFYSNCDGGLDSAKTMTFASSGILSAPSFSGDVTSCSMSFNSGCFINYEDSEVTSTWLCGFDPSDAYHHIRATRSISTSFTAQNFYAKSDIRLKKNLIKNPNLNYYDILNKVNLYKFDWKNENNNKTNTHNFGTIAQELRDIMPDDLKDFFINTDEEKEHYLSINDNKLVYMVIGALKEQTDINKKLENKIEKLENKLKEYQSLEERLKKLEEKINGN